MQTSGLKFLAVVTQAPGWGPTAGLDGGNIQEVTFRNTFVGIDFSYQELFMEVRPNGKN